MKFIRLTAAMLFLAAFSAVPSFAQTAGAAATPTVSTTVRIAVIDTGAFGDEKQGIAKYITAAKQLDTTFAPRRTELQTMTTQYQNLVKELETLSKPTPGSPVSPQSVNAKREQAEKLQRDIEYKQKEAQAAYQAESGKTIGPLFVDIGKAIQEYAKQKGYTVVLDLAKMADNGMLLAVDQTADVTADFIKFYNQRPAGTASAATPK